MRSKTEEWFAFARRCGEKIYRALSTVQDPADRLRETGTVGQGGDKTLQLDAAAETCVFQELDLLHHRGWSFSALSEERGYVNYGSDKPLVVIDPIDGSMNAKRGLWPHGLSIAVANGSTMADVYFGYVYDFTTQEEWHAIEGQGAYCNGKKLLPAQERLSDDNRLEVLAIESADPRWITKNIGKLEDNVYRIRAFGSIALSLCQLADNRVDAMVSLWRCRAVDVAAAQLIVRESGGYINFSCFKENPLAAPLDLLPHSRVVGAQNTQRLQMFSEL